MCVCVYVYQLFLLLCQLLLFKLMSFNTDKEISNWEYYTFDQNNIYFDLRIFKTISVFSKNFINILYLFILWGKVQFSA